MVDGEPAAATGYVDIDTACLKFCSCGTLSWVEGSKRRCSVEINSALTYGVAGIQKGMDGLARNAAEIASEKAMTGEQSVIEPLIYSKLNRLQVEASVKVVSTVDEMLGFLLDQRA